MAEFKAMSPQEQEKALRELVEKEPPPGEAAKSGADRQGAWQRRAAPDRRRDVRPTP